MANGWGDNTWGDLGWGGNTIYEVSVQEYLTTPVGWGESAWGDNTWGGIPTISETQATITAYAVSVTESLYGTTPWGEGAWLLPISLGLAVGLTVISGWNYVWSSRYLLRGR